jgi:hypothetical protein
MHPTDFAGLGGIALCTGAALLAVPGASRLGRRGRAILLGMALLLLALPYDGLPLVAYLRGVSGDLSVTALVLAAAGIARRFSGRIEVDAQARLRLLGCIALLALLFYPLALGIGMFDPYRLGFGDPWLIGALILLALWSWRQGLDLAVLCIALALLAWALGGYESTNLWDYLLDPLLAVYAAGLLLIAAVKRLT